MILSLCNEIWRQANTTWTRIRQNPCALAGWSAAAFMLLLLLATAGSNRLGISTWHSALGSEVLAAGEVLEGKGGVTLVSAFFQFPNGKKHFVHGLPLPSRTSTIPLKAFLQSTGSGCTTFLRMWNSQWSFILHQISLHKSRICAVTRLVIAFPLQTISQYCDPAYNNH